MENFSPHGQANHSRGKSASCGHRNGGQHCGGENDDRANKFQANCEPPIGIDGLNISTIGLLDLRRRLAIIPQDAALFEGTIRDNLDPRHVHDDTELWSVLGTYGM